MHPKFILANAKTLISRTSLPAEVIPIDEGAYIFIADGVIRIVLSETSIRVNGRLETFANWMQTHERFQFAIACADKHNPYKVGGKNV